MCGGKFRRPFLSSLLYLSILDLLLKTFDSLKKKIVIAYHGFITYVDIR